VQFTSRALKEKIMVLSFPRFCAGICRVLMMGALLLPALAPSLASAQSRDCVRGLSGETVCPPPRTMCMADVDNPAVKCSPPDGGILHNRYGRATCGAGACAVDMRGDVFCSKSVAGAASKNMYGDVVCTDGCEPASPARCTTLTK
jgi:hypothetical protein